MKVFILGSEGFIGKNCVQYFLHRNIEVSGCDLLDLKDPEYKYFKISRISPEFNDFFHKGQFDVCINAAGSGSVPHSISYPYADFEANTIDTFKVLEAIRIYNSSCKYISFSSAAVYGNPKKLPIKETDELLPLSPYGWHKLYSEFICKEYSSLYNIATCSVRPFSVFGPGLKKQLFWDLYQKSLQSKDISLFGTGKESRDFIYITDLVFALSLIIEKAPMKGEVYNIANGKETTIFEVASLFLNNLGDGFTLLFNGESRVGDPLNWRADVKSIQNLGYKDKIGLEQGLINYIQWLKEKR